MLFVIYYHILNVICGIFCRTRIRGTEHLPEGRAIICGNHTSMMDPLFVAMAMYKRRRHIPKFMAKIELSRIPVLSAMLAPLLVFVDRGKADLGAIKNTIKILKDGKKIIIFPEGRRVNAGEDAQAKTGVAMMALKAEAPIVPVWISEGKKNLFRFPKVDIVFGESYLPVKREDLSTSEAYREIVDDLMERIRILKATVRPPEERKRSS